MNIIISNTKPGLNNMDPAKSYIKVFLLIIDYLLVNNFIIYHNKDNLEQYVGYKYIFVNIQIFFNKKSITTYIYKSNIKNNVNVYKTNCIRIKDVIINNNYNNKVNKFKL